MKIIYLNRINGDDETLHGIYSKMKDQCLAFKKLGHEVSMHHYCNQGLSMDGSVIHPVPTWIIKRFKYVFLHMLFFKLVKSRCPSLECDLLYIRYPYASYSFVSFLRRFTRIFPKSKIIIEIPTYPYHREKNGLLRLQMLLDRVWFPKLRRHVDGIVSYDKSTSIHGIPVINISNGVQVPERIPAERPPADSIRFVAVGRWAHWHGLDRFIKGMSAYMDEKDPVDPDIYLSIVGPRRQEDVDLVHALGLERNCQFYGYLTGMDLSEILYRSHYGVGTLGLHRINVAINSALKVRMYAAHGLPFLLAAPDLDFSEETPFVHFAPANDDAISIWSVLDTFSESSFSREDIHAYAQERLGWRPRMQMVIDYCNRL